MDTRSSSNTSGSFQSQSYYQTVLSQCEKVEANVADVQHHLSSFLEAINAAGHSGVLLADALVRLFSETPLWSVAVHYKEKAESLSELASRTTSQVSQDVSSVLHKYTHLTPGTKAAVDGHQKSLRELDSARERVDELGSCRDVERRRRAETRFERATEQYVADDVRLVKAVQDIHDQKMQVIVVYFIDYCHRKHAFGEAFVSRNTCTQPYKIDLVNVISGCWQFQMLGPALLTLFQTQASYYSQSFEVLSALGKYREVGDVFRDSKASSCVKKATAQWLAAAQAYASLRKNSLSHNDVQCILLCAQGNEIPDHMKSSLNSKIDRLLQEYKKELSRNPLKQFTCLGGFHLNPKGIELALEGCCSDLEAKGAGGWKDELDSEETMAQICRDTSRVEYRIGQQWFDTVPAGKVAEGAKAKLRAISEMVKTMAVTLNVAPSQLDEFSMCVLNETCSTVANCASRTVVQLVFGVANLVLVKPSSDHFDNRPTVITSQHDAIQIEVSSCWWLVEDTPTLYHIRPNVDPSMRLGGVDVVYQRTFSVSNWLASKAQPLPIVCVRWQQDLLPHKSSTESGGTARSLRNSISRVSMKFTSKLNRYSERRSSGSWKENVCPQQATFQSYVDLEETGEKAENAQAPTDQPVPPPRLRGRHDRTALEVEDEKRESEKDDSTSRSGETRETNREEDGETLQWRSDVVEPMRDAGSGQITDSNGKVTETGQDRGDENTQRNDDMQKLTETHLASPAELQSVIDFLSGYPISNRSLQQADDVGTVANASVPFNYEFDSDLFDGFIPPHQWPRSCSGTSSNGRASFNNGRSGSLGRNRGSSLGRSSRGSGCSDCLQDDVTPYGYDVIYEAACPGGGRTVDGCLTNNYCLAQKSKPVGERSDFTSGFDMVQQGIDPVRILAPPHDHGLLVSNSADLVASANSRQNTLALRRTLPSLSKPSHQGHTEVLNRSPATWPRGKSAPWASASSEHSELQHTFSPNNGYNVMQGKGRDSSQCNTGVASPRAFSSDSSSPSSSPPLSPGRSIQQQQGAMTYATTAAQPHWRNRNQGRNHFANQQVFGVGGSPYLQDWERQWNLQQKNLDRMLQS
ncbi:uncharacterized protein LOC134178618 isoform X2 [Corticium candelabrum]|uniref:uncharacterized protein LOC134178618 isoform X2 n=1 Tax=Corticium candelabrum TaxID=121492 RepID=UPI002E268E1E|nr:uncharacterized protein LOC134178618 isoform X2 [Corticium candelabrum]